jgi:anaerobic magnesium-protoporphyrin IX monomethyl ester cyclase
MAKVLFINPIVRGDDNPKHVPYGIALLAAILRQNARHRFQVFDGNAWRVPDTVIADILRADDWDVIALGGITTTYGHVKTLVRMARAVRPGALIVVGGGLVTSQPRDIMTLLPDIDIGVIGEAFQTFPELLDRVEDATRAWDTVKGIIWRAPDRTLHLTPERSLVHEIDTIPYPAWDLFPLDIYFRNSSLLYSEESFTARRRLDFNGSYGCPFICRFCFHLGLAGDMVYESRPDGAMDVVFTHDRMNRWHSPRYIVDMAKYARERFGLDFALFFDENLLAINSASRNRWLPELCRLWIEEGLQPSCVREGVAHDERCTGVHWGGTSHAALANPTILRQMREAGCSQLLYGLESFNRRILKNMGKGSTPESNVRAVQLTLEAGIRPIPNQIIGFPDEWFDSLYDAIRAWDDLGIVVKPFFATPYPGSEWYYRYKDRILAQYDNDMDAFLTDLGDATKITANICEHFNAVELLGLRELMVARDIKRIQEYERLWVATHGQPAFSDVRWPGAERRRTGARVTAEAAKVLVAGAEPAPVVGRAGQQRPR